MEEGCLWVCLLLTLAATLASSTEQHYSNDFTIEVEGGEEAARRVASSHGLEYITQLRSLGDIHILSHPQVSSRSKRSAESVLERLREDPNVKYVQQEKLLKRVKRRALAAEPEKVHERNKRMILHDKQKEFPIRTYRDKSVYQYYGNDRLTSRAHLGGSDASMDFNDPYYDHQWYLHNRGQTGGPEGHDLDVVTVWKKGFTGLGVTVCILDDGIEHTHPDLHANYNRAASADLNDRSDEEGDPMPDEDNPDNRHGTRCAGEVAAVANNGVCGVGVAYNASIGGVRMLDGPITDSLEAQALNHALDLVDIYSSSWGPMDDGCHWEGPGPRATEALEIGTREGRGGLGAIYVWATGNGGENDDTCSCDGYVSNIHTLAIGCVSDRGYSTYYSEQCPATFAVTYTGGSHSPPGEKDYRSPRIKVVTTDIGNDCTLGFQGTSSAAPLAAGIIALTLQANPNLSWRDVQHIVVETAAIPNEMEDGWTSNGAGYHVNAHFGFGVLDAGLMVELAQNWEPVGPQHQCHITSEDSEISIPSQDTLALELTTDACSSMPDNSTNSLEHVQLYINLDHSHRGDLVINLTSPSGTVSQMLTNRIHDNETEGIDFYFLTVHCWGEDPLGTWLLEIADNPPSNSHRVNTGTLHEWGLVFYGTANKGLRSNSFHNTLSSKQAQTAHVVQQAEIMEIMAEEEDESNNIQIDEADREIMAENRQQDLGQEEDQSITTFLDRFQSLIDRSQDDNKNSYYNNYGNSNYNSRYNNNYYSGYENSRNNYVSSSRSNSRSRYDKQNRNYPDSYITQKKRKLYEDGLTEEDIDAMIAELSKYLDE